MFTVYQARLTKKDADLISENGWEVARQLSENVDAFYMATVTNEFQKSFNLGQHRKVARIEANDLEDVFTIGNVGPETRIVKLDTMFSVSVGDIIEDPTNGEFYAVAPIGFKKITKMGQ